VNASVETSEPRAYYERLEVVYDPEDPSRYEEKPVYDRYSRTWMLFFFGLLVPSVVGMMAYGPLHMVAALSASPESRRPVRSGI
jgi:hypothetical protein